MRLYQDICFTVSHRTKALTVVEPLKSLFNLYFCIYGDGAKPTVSLEEYYILLYSAFAFIVIKSSVIAVLKWF